MTQVISSSNGVDIVSYETWMAAIASSACIGFTSLVPWLFNLTFFEKELAKTKGDGPMKYLLSFAVGAILGDIFFHLIPESYQSHHIDSTIGSSIVDAHKKVGLAIIGGIFMFIIVDAILENWSQSINNNDASKAIKSRVEEKSPSPVSVDSAGYLNLIANGFDNFTHGLAIGASFLIGLKVGFLTTFVIIIHEIPHEICDYAIIVNSGFTRWEAVKAQSSVSLFGILGTALALYVKSVETLNEKTHWILPFSAGSFLYIALVNLLPEILDGKADLRSTLGQVICVIIGIMFMKVVAIF